jgi:hypothetical protein
VAAFAAPQLRAAMQHKMPRQARMMSVEAHIAVQQKKFLIGAQFSA